MFIFCTVVAVLLAILSLYNTVQALRWDTIDKYLNPVGWNNGIRFLRKAYVLTIIAIGFAVYFH